MRLKILMFLLSLSTLANAKDNVYFAYGWGMDDTLIQSGSIASTQGMGIGFQYDLNKSFEDKILGVGHWYLSTEWHRLKGAHASENYDMTIWAIKPTLRLYHNDDINSDWSYEAALGIAHLSTTEYEEIKMSSDYNFAMHFSVAYHFGKQHEWSSSLRYNHYSNGYLEQPNPGLDFASLTIHYHF
ncbi:acyloxyacyl hydrolase [Pleionea sediminis]|uniref:acyloxyacyl hydrolase n=1 Tax=Pleionea sediminis TaxID=2569479 RepID=UPI001184E574|nr:acyloxyacyl hydrolase [Pleionea sediminis]